MVKANGIESLGCGLEHQAIYASYVRYYIKKMEIKVKPIVTYKKTLLKKIILNRGLFVF